MKLAIFPVISMLAMGCVTVRPMPSPNDLFHDELFGAASETVDPDAALMISEEMRAYLDERIGHHVGDRRKELIKALYNDKELKLEYDATETRTASQAFESRSGNCLALVLMTASFAKSLGMTVHYQLVLGDEEWDRAGHLYLSLGHVNLTLAEVPSIDEVSMSSNDSMTVDFITPQRGVFQRTRQVEEHTLIAMYLNNRAVETLALGQLDDAYAWARAALLKDPQLEPAYLSLGAIYRAAHHPEQAEATLQRLLEREPDHLVALGNRVLVLRDLGRREEADALTLRLQRLDPHPAFSYFRKGQEALREGRLEEAKELFEKEAFRSFHEFQFWLAITYIRMGDMKSAAAHLTRAMELSSTRRDHQLYAAKLERLKALSAR
jgi:tetratricopeptide (TPR) repeat protein